MDIPLGSTHEETVTVDGSAVASAVGSGVVDVFATPMLIALMEKAAVRCLAPYLEAGWTSVGTRVEVEHTGATPIGMAVTASARVVTVAGRRVEFAVSAWDAAGEVGRGSHTRFLVERDRFMEKAQAKLTGNAP